MTTPHLKDPGARAAAALRDADAIAWQRLAADYYKLSVLARDAGEDSPAITAQRGAARAYLCARRAAGALSGGVMPDGSYRSEAEACG